MEKSINLINQNMSHVSILIWRTYILSNEVHSLLFLPNDMVEVIISINYSHTYRVGGNVNVPRMFQKPVSDCRLGTQWEADDVVSLPKPFCSAFIAKIRKKCENIINATALKVLVVATATLEIKHGIHVTASFWEPFQPRRIGPWHYLFGYRRFAWHRFCRFGHQQDYKIM